MCECGCASQEFREAFQVKGTSTVVAYQVFPGCADCDYGPGVSISFFDSPKSEFLEGLKIEKVHPNEFGAGRDDREAKWRAGGFGFGILDVEDLVGAAKEIEKSAPVDGYESVSEWLEEHGSELLRSAVVACADRQRRHDEGKRA